MPNTTYHIAVCDDETTFLIDIQHKINLLLEKEHITCSISCYQSGDALLDAVIKQKEEFHLILLDILLDDINGILLAQKLRDTGLDLPIIFISSTSEFALQGYEVSALRYLLKPVQDPQLRDAILYCYSKSREEKAILLKCGTSYRKIAFTDIYYMEIRGHVLKLYLQSQPGITVSMKMSEAEERFPATQFFRCHQSFMVNMAYIENIRRYQIVLLNGTLIPVSKSRYLETRQKLLEYLSL